LTHVQRRRRVHLHRCRTDGARHVPLEARARSRSPELGPAARAGAGALDQRIQQTALGV